MNSITRFKKQKWYWLTALVLIIIIKIFSQDDYNVEHFYSNDFYKLFGSISRLLTGWIFFSVGDILYLLAGCWIFWKILRNCMLLFKRKFTWDVFAGKLLKFIFLLAMIYIVFNIFWGLNYNRKGIATQLNIAVVDYDTVNLKLMQQLLLKKVNETKHELVNENSIYPSNKDLFVRAKKCYEQTAVVYPFIQYKNLSIKSSMYGWLGNYLGFTGYYNPFTGEAQVNTTVPKFLLPYITLHEMGHQIGYAKEDEANFSGYLAAANSSDTLFQYSAYLDLFVYANREIFFFDSAASKIAIQQLIPQVRKDLREWKHFNEQYTSIFEPAISWLYGKYLQENQQPKGLRSYNEVIATLIAYYKKFGRI
jgi:hypothetical protein